jgi:hypothetical protein
MDEDHVDAACAWLNLEADVLGDIAEGETVWTKFVSCSAYKREHESSWWMGSVRTVWKSSTSSLDRIYLKD